MGIFLREARHGDRLELQFEMDLDASLPLCLRSDAVAASFLSVRVLFVLEFAVIGGSW
jgi:hypothetical protein